MSKRPVEAPSGVDALDRFWRRRPFHDMPIEEVSAVNKRVIIRLEEFTLVITGATDLMRCPLPADWLNDSITKRAGRYLFDIETTEGHLTVAGVDIRLIRNSDLAILIPPIDT